MDIDIVYTWVNHKDPKWQELNYKEHSKSLLTSATDSSINSLSRFINRDELYYSIKSVDKFAPWVRKIFVVTNCSIPKWIQENTKITPVTHEEIFPDISVLPTFNSRAIEANLHRITELAEHFLYLNDDMFLSQPTEKSTFFDQSGEPYIFPCKHDVRYPPQNKLRPIDYGILNACALLKKEFNYTPQKKLHHSAYPLRKSTLQEIEDVYPNEISTTRNNKFRDNEDLPLATTMHAYYSVVKGYGKIKAIESRYIDIGNPLFVFLIHPFSRLRRGQYTTFCLNEVNELPLLSNFRDRIVKRLLIKLYGT